MDVPVNRLFRIFRGIATNAVLWGLGWLIVGSIYHSAMVFLEGAPFDWRLALSAAKVYGVTGALAGAAFSGYIAAAYRRHSLDDVTPARFALGGGLVTALVGFGFVLWFGLRYPGFWPPPLLDVLIPMGVFAVIGSTTGASMLAIAQHQYERLEPSVQPHGLTSASS